jgi:O-antigen/teichoic acid export membrane protein
MVRRSRSQQFAVNAGMGYALIGANILYTLLSIPLALRYLGKEEFGLWALAQQIAGYLILIDFGLSSAVSRLLANHKDHVNGGSYGALLVTGAFVFSLQGFIVFALGGVFALYAPPLFQIPPALVDDFRNLIIILAAVSGATIALRSITAPLWAFQRLDVSYGIGIISLLLALASLWMGFLLGWGIYSFAVAGIPAMVVCTTLGFEICRRAGLYPTRGCWGRPSWDAFKEMFTFGKDVMLMSIGSQLVNASQIMILGRAAGLEAAATFAIGTKFYALGSQLTGRLVESSAPALTEMFVQSDHGRLQHRFNDIFRTSLFLATAGSVALLAANAMVVGWWTSGVILWSFSWDLLLGLLLMATAASRCLVGLFGIAGNLRPVRNFYLVEAAVFIAAGIPAASSFGVPGLLVASLGAHLLVTTIFSALAARKIVGPLHALLRPSLLAIAILAGAAVLTGLLQGAPAHLGPIGAAVVIAGFSTLAAATLLSTDAKHRMFTKMFRFVGASR